MVLIHEPTEREREIAIVNQEFMECGHWLIVRHKHLNLHRRSAIITHIFKYIHVVCTTRYMYDKRSILKKQFIID